VDVLTRGLMMTGEGGVAVVVDVSEGDGRVGTFLEDEGVDDLVWS
jgi:hypothetical protein